jgi:hypothetical protein
MRLRLDVFAHHATSDDVIRLFFFVIVQNPDPTRFVQFFQHALVVRKVVAIIFSGREWRNIECAVSTTSVKTRVECKVHLFLLYFIFIGM